MNACETWGKDFIKDARRFREWVAETTRVILNESCEDEDEISAMLSGTQPKAFPVIAVWWYVSHSIFVEYVVSGDLKPKTGPKWIARMMEDRAFESEEASE